MALRIPGWKWRAGLAVLAVVSAPSVLAAQACLGLPQGADGAFGAVFSFPEGGRGYALGGTAASSSGDVFFQGQFGIVAPDAEPASNTKIVSGGMAYEIAALTPGVSACPVVGVGFSWVEDLNVWSVPFGIGVGGTIPFGRKREAGLTPWLIPRFLYERVSIDDVDDSEVSDVFVGASGGVTVHVAAFTLTGAFTKLLEEEQDAEFFLVVGVAW